ncbi:proton-conducting transporter transmembrane domain-containing protein [Dermatobacter hominis]|uniref:proton-conducting transporter transmembrane domain-containing protein n=1 Tax=Dermatobacter hominis TaxID=2884263 RepID=UPI001D12E77A|nr:proton-conducting transporter membrane subunit [Dermatobacter hominis]UDY37620.1 hypothetical protein LH044_08785 [Dermatobacter hominis]
MPTLMTTLVLIAPASFLVAAATGLVPRLRSSEVVVRAGKVAAGVGVVAAVAAASSVAVDGAVTGPTLGWDGLGASIRLDALSVTMLTMVSILAAVVFAYSCTYLEGDPRRGTFLVRLAQTIAAVEVLVIAGNLALLVLAWIGASLGLHRLLTFDPHRVRAVLAARKRFVVARVCDVALVLACVLLHQRFGTGDLAAISRSLELDPGGADVATVVAALAVVVAAALKSAQFPTQGWLIEVMETPTPVSALLHAGLLNAGPFLVLRSSAVVDGAVAATTVLIVVGATTALVASVILLTQPSVKVSLAYSSAAHMGFMLLICGMGFYSAALLHLVAHSFYKAHAFLSSGSTVDERRASTVHLPARLGRPGPLVLSALVAAGLYLGIAMLLGVEVVDEPMLLLVGAVLVMGTSLLIAPALDARSFPAVRAVAVVAAAGVTSSFFLLEAGAHRLLDGTVVEPDTRTPLQVALVLVVLTAFAWVIRLQMLHPSGPPSARARRMLVHLRNGLYADVAFERVVAAIWPHPSAPAANVPALVRPTRASEVPS